jgi:hypothetical protein
VTSTALLLIAMVVLPLWILAGFADWVAHRVTHIETTSGWRESALHLVQLAEVGAVILAALFFEVNGALVVFAVAMIAIHEVTTWIDLTYAGPRRRIAPVEQMIHSLLEVLPLAALLLLLAHRWPDLPGLAASLRDFEPRLAHPPIPTGWLVGLAAAVGAFGVAPYAEELWRCLRADRAR